MSAVLPAAGPSLETTEAQRAGIRESVTAGAALTGPYVAMNMAAAFIAGFGLMENSPAVIIGAMLNCNAIWPYCRHCDGARRGGPSLAYPSIGSGSCWSRVRSCRRFIDWLLDAPP